MAPSGGLLFIGSKALGLAVLQTVVASRPDRVSAVLTFDDSMDDRSVFRGFKEFCADASLDLRVLTRKTDLAAVVGELSPAVVLVAGWYWMIENALIRSVPNGFVGVHASLLPEYRGHAPLVWALINGESQTGVTLFSMDGGMDTGNIIDQVEVSLSPTMSINELLTTAETAACTLVGRQLEGLLEGTASGEPQDGGRASYGSLRADPDGRIDWTSSAREIHDFIRAQTRPYPGAFTEFEDGRRLRIWECEPFSERYSGIPGLAQQATETGRVICCGNGAVVVTNCTIEGELSHDSKRLIPWGARCH